jgi:hypothetical protein
MRENKENKFLYKSQIYLMVARENLWLKYLLLDPNLNFSLNYNFLSICKVREMQNSSEVFKSNFNYYQRGADKKFSWQNFLLDFPTSLFPVGEPSWNIVFYS